MSVSLTPIERPTEIGNLAARGGRNRSSAADGSTAASSSSADVVDLSEAGLSALYARDAAVIDSSSSSQQDKIDAFLQYGTTLRAAMPSLGLDADGALQQQFTVATQNASFMTRQVAAVESAVSAYRAGYSSSHPGQDDDPEAAGEGERASIRTMSVQDQEIYAAAFGPEEVLRSNGSASDGAQAGWSEQRSSVDVGSVAGPRASPLAAADAVVSDGMAALTLLGSTSADTGARRGVASRS